MAAIALVAALGANAPAVASDDLAALRLVDLTYTFDAKTIYWPTEKGFELQRRTAGWVEAGYYYEAHRFRSAEHGGTHIDAPIHFAEGRLKLDQLPLEQLVARAVLIDVSRQCQADRDYAIGEADLRAWETRHGAIPEAAIVLFRTGFGRHWPDPKRYLGTDLKGAEAVARLHFPGLAPGAARWLVRERNIKAVGIDTASIDPGQSKLFDAHQILLSQNIPAFENLANLDQLPERGFQIVALPMKIGGGSGGPLRAIALLPRE